MTRLPADRVRAARTTITGTTCAAALALALGAAAPATAQLLGVGNDRPHPELRWMEFETEHFLLIYPQHLDDVALRAAAVAEQVYDPITRGLDVTMPRRTSILLTDEDQIVNGFALPDRMFIWVNLNDYATRFSGTDKWLRKVIAHEFQHDVWFEAARDWTGVWGLSGTPAWFIEGLAEYETEPWGPERSDLEVREKILRNRHRSLDAHDSGFSMVRYMADTYGDSTIVHAVKKRNALGLARFADGFREAAGISLKEFEEEWRRAATAHTYALFAQKEAVTDAGEHRKPPAKRLRSLRWSADGAWMAVLSRPSGGAAVLSAVRNDSTRERYVIDHGRIDGEFALSPDGSHVVYAKWHRGRHGSLLWDLKVARVGGTSRWITRSRRASHPDWSPAGDRIVYTAIDGSTTNLYTCDPDGGDVRALTHHGDDVQVFSPRFSPEGSRLAFARFPPGGSIDLVTMNLPGGDTRQLTRNEAYDTRPLWSPDGSRLFFTSHRNRDGVPNLFTVPATGGESDVACMTDVGEALHGLDVDPTDSTVVAIAMASTDTVRLRAIPPDRRVPITDPKIREPLVRWRDRVPPHPIPPVDATAVPTHSTPRPYRAWRHLHNLFWFALPSFEPWGVAGGGLWMDRAHRLQAFVAGDVGTENDRLRLRALFAHVSTNDIPFGLPGFLTVAGGLEARSHLRLYGNDLFVDQRDGVRARWRQPLNFGEHLYANHDLEVHADFWRIQVEDRDDVDLPDLARRGLPRPRFEYQENTLGATYRYRRVRPHARSYAHAHTGHGLLARATWSDAALGSDFDYRRLEADAAKVITPPVLGAFGSFLLRTRYDQVWGDVPPQDFVGLRADPPLLPRTYARAPLVEDLVGVDHGFFLRGFPRNVPCDRALLTTLEWRIPLLPPLPVQAFALSPGGLTGVLFWDHGRVWQDGSSLLARHTVGWELRLPVRLGRETLLTGSYGEGQTLSWERGAAPFVRDPYFRIAVVEPF